MTCYAIRSLASGLFWCGGHVWDVAEAHALRFTSMTAANLAGVVELPDPVETWTVVPVEAR